MGASSRACSAEAPASPHVCAMLAVNRTRSIVQRLFFLVVLVIAGFVDLHHA